MGKTSLVTRALLSWFVLFALAFVNGAAREFGFKNLGEPLAHQLSCVTGVTLWTSFTFVIWKWLGIHSFKAAAMVGGGWFVLTVLVETFFLNRNLSWAEVAHTYDVSAGEYWGLVLLWIGLMPVVIYGVRRRA